MLLAELPVLDADSGPEVMDAMDVTELADGSDGPGDSSGV